MFEHAYAIGLETEPETEPPVTFSTLLMALLVGTDDTSRWFSEATQANGPDSDAVFAEKGSAATAVSSLTPAPGKPDHVRLSSDLHLLTSSARTVVGNAEGWAQHVGGSDIGVRHLVAAYVLNPPPAHYAQMQRWKYHEAHWRAEFFRWVAERYTAEQWSETQYRPAPAKGACEFDAQRVKGEALAYPGTTGTMAVLERAAMFHARARDRWLRLRTVFCALVETAREDVQLRATIEPIWNRTQAAAKSYEREYEEILASPEPDDAIASFSTVDISPRVLNALETARELTLSSRRDGDAPVEVGVLQLAGALVSRRVDADGDLARFGLEARPLRLALIEHARLRGESLEVWREALGEEESLQAGRPVDLSSDEPEAVVRLDEAWTNDPLAIRADVETFAALLASKRLEPPLSIGLFGPWGSGKTTFLKRLRRAVDQRAREAQTVAATGSTPYVRNVVHVDFNAWHFAEGALTSSLVDTILRAISEYIKDDKLVAGKAWAQQKREQLESTKRQLEAARAIEQVAAARVSEAEQALATAHESAASALTSIQALASGVWAATQTAVERDGVVKESGILGAVGNAVSSVDELRERLNTVRTRPARLIADLGWGPSLLFAALVLAVPPLVASFVGWVLKRDQAMQLASWLTATMSVIAIWARTATGAVSKVDKAITHVVDEYKQRLAKDPDVGRAKVALEAAQTRAATAEAGVQAARDKLARAQLELANASLPAQMLQLVSERIAAQTYKSELTTLSLARADLQALSQLLREQRSESSNADPSSPQGEGVTQPTRAVDRVILYIDDLDRCKPEDVVRVLQLVHMLLAFELFVVVVAVDASWVRESLRQSYPWLAEDALEGRCAHVTPQDYLEKIFQIAFWLEPMTASRAASYIGSLVPLATRESGPVFGTVDARARFSAPALPTAELTTMDITGIELDYMRALAAYVGSSPRRVKRLVNAYRLIKASLGDAQLRNFLTDRTGDDGKLRSGPYQVVIGLLVIGTGAPASSADVLEELCVSDPTHEWSAVIERFRSRNHHDWTIAARVLETVMRTQNAKNVSELRGWARKVGRFLLNGPTAARSVAPGTL